MLVSTILTGVAIGSLGVVVKEGFVASKGLLKKLNPFKEVEEFGNEILEDTWVELWMNSGVRVKVDDGYLVPSLMNRWKTPNGIRYLFSYPIGLTSAKMETCSLQIKELANAVDVQVKHFQNDMVYIDVKNKEIEEEISQEIKQEQKKWDELWLTVKKYVDNDFRGKVTPKVIKIEEWACGKSYFFKMPVGLSTHEIKKVDIAIKEFLGALRIEIKASDEEKGVMEIKSYTKPLPASVPYENVLREKKDELEIVVGQGYEDWARLRLLGGTHNLLIGGAVGTGKSICTTSILTDIALNFSPDELVMYICDLKVVELPEFQHLKHCREYKYEVQDLCDMIDDLTKEMRDRYDKFLAMGVTSLSNYNERVSEDEKLPYILLVIEEIIEFSTHEYTKSKKYEQKLATFLSKCRGAGMGCICTTQRGTDESIPRKVRAHLCNRILFKVSDENESRIFTEGKFALDTLRGMGHGVLISGDTVQEFQGFYINKDKGELHNILKKNNLLKDE